MAKTAKTQRRGEITKQQLIEFTKARLVEHDFESITLDKISREVGVSKSSILWHFGSKEKLLTAALYSVFEDIQRALALANRKLPTFDERMEHLLTTVARYFTSNRGARGVAITMIFDRNVPPGVRARIRRYWAEQVQDMAAFLAGDDCEFAEANAEGLLALMHGVYIQWYLDGCPDGLRERLLDACYGLRLNKARDYL